MSERLRIALCDDHPIIRGGLRRLLDAEPDIDIVGDVGTIAEAVTLVAETQPAVLILDLGLPDGSGLDAIQRIRDAAPDCEVLVLTMHEDLAYVRAAFDRGAAGYVLKDAAELELLVAARTVAAGGRYVQPALGAALVAPARQSAPLPAGGGGLTERETAILRLIALGYTNVEMAELLALSVRTVQSHRAHIQQKLGIRSRAALARYALDAGLLATELRVDNS